jgi:hypothetical protein
VDAAAIVRALPQQLLECAMIVTLNAGMWEEMMRRPLLERCGVAPDEILAYVGLVNAACDNPAVPSAVAIPADFAADLHDAIAEMPEVVRQLLDHPLLGVFVCDGLGSSAITDIVVTPQGQVLGVVTAIDLGSFRERTANAWATWKESSPFAANGRYTVDTVIEEPANDNRKNAIQFILLHEFGHVLTAGTGFLPDWWIDPQDVGSTEDYSFLPLSWQVTEDKRIVPLAQDDFALRGSLKYYADGQLAGDAVLDVFEAVGKTSFATAYAATNAYEDFAESFASYVHTVLMKKPLEIRVSIQGQILVRHPERWSDSRCGQKRDLFASFLGHG